VQPDIGGTKSRVHCSRSWSGHGRAAGSILKLPLSVCDSQRRGKDLSSKFPFTVVARYIAAAKILIPPPRRSIN